MVNYTKTHTFLIITVIKKFFPMKHITEEEHSMTNHRKT